MFIQKQANCVYALKIYLTTFLENYNLVGFGKHRLETIFHWRGASVHLIFTNTKAEQRRCYGVCICLL